MVARQEKVIRLQVAVDHSPAMREGQGLAGLLEVQQSLIEFKRITGTCPT